MPKFKVLVDNQFGEGWMTGDVIYMDWEAAKKRVEIKHLELLDEEEPVAIPVKTFEEKVVEAMVVANEVEKPILEANNDIVEPIVEQPKRFCESCDSKGVRHKKDCPTLKTI